MYLEVPATPEVCVLYILKLPDSITFLCHLAIVLFLEKDYLINPSDFVFFKTCQFHFVNCFIVDAATLRVIHLSSSEDKTLLTKFTKIFS
jgi:hypothetical protein